MIEITPEVYSSMGLNDSEYQLLVELLGRTPSYTELGMFAVMWSEHCGYKYSRPVLARFKQYKEAIEGAGLENAGVVPIGGGLGITMKVESHNHPSFVEPYQGAATGVGGIIRDILTMGARPIALLNSLRFGPINAGGASEAVVAKNRYLFEHVVEGIAGYGNCVGVPTVAGEVNFHPGYSGNPLVNAMCVGILKLDQVTTAAASGVGNSVIYLGSATGRDGIHGATFASESFDDDSDAKRPNVQIGDPFAEKQLIEATLEALKTGAVVAIQDMGAAGLTCSTIEMASMGGVGMEINLDLVPMRESDMSGYELMLSESQERMLAVSTPERAHEVIEVFQKWGVHAVVIGTVTDGPNVTITRSNEVIANLDPTLLTDHCPVYHCELAEPASFVNDAKFSPAGFESTDPANDLLTLLAWPDIASKRYVYEQYDQQVQTQTVVVAGAAAAAVIAPRDAGGRAFAVKLDGNARYVQQHPHRGGQLAVVEAARNVACTGAMPTAITDGLNFGNPTDPRIYWQFKEAIYGIADASEALGTPVISGNVSFYNESETGEIPPTPMIGMLGMLNSAEHAVGIAAVPDCDLVLIRCNPGSTEHGGIGASAYLSAIHGHEGGYPESPNLAGELSLVSMLHQVAAQGLLEFAHDVSEGGLAVTAAECAITGKCGLELTLTDLATECQLNPTSVLFGEWPGWVLVGTKHTELLRDFVTKFGLKMTEVGRTGITIDMNVSVGSTQFSVDRAAAAQFWETSISKLMSE